MRASFVLFLLAALAACSSQKDKELEAVKSARSVLAEWALVEEQAARDRAPSTYVEVMRKQARDQLKTAQKQLVGQPQAKSVLERLQAGSPDAGALKQADSILEPLEKSLEVS
jgi:hypothetical protein